MFKKKTKKNAGLVQRWCAEFKTIRTFDHVMLALAIRPTRCRWTEGKRQQIPLWKHQPGANPILMLRIRKCMSCILTEVFLLYSFFYPAHFVKRGLQTCLCWSAHKSSGQRPTSLGHVVPKFFNLPINFLHFSQKSLLHAAPPHWITRVMSCSAGPPTPADGKHFVLSRSAGFPSSLLPARMNLPYAKTWDGKGSGLSRSRREV